MSVNILKEAQKGINQKILLQSINLIYFNNHKQRGQNEIHNKKQYHFRQWF